VRSIEATAIDQLASRDEVMEDLLLDALTRRALGE
jgi:hypothetical protein